MKRSRTPSPQAAIRKTPPSPSPPACCNACRAMSDAQREQVGALLDALTTELHASLAARPGMDAARAERVFDQGFLRGDAAKDAGIANGTCYDDELPLRLAGESAAGSANNAERLGVDLAELLLQQGARALLETIEATGD